MAAMALVGGISPSAYSPIHMMLGMARAAPPEWSELSSGVDRLGRPTKLAPFGLVSHRFFVTQVDHQAWSVLQYLDDFVA